MTQRVAATRFEDIVDAVCVEYRLNGMELRSARRTRALAEARHVASYIASRLTFLSLPQIGARLGQRDHTTILHGRNRIRARIVEELDLAERVGAIEVAAVAITRLRLASAIPEAERARTPVDVARAVRARGTRGAVCVSVEDILALCDHIIAFDDMLEGGLPAPAHGIPPDTRDLLADLFAAQQALTMRPTTVNRLLRDDAVEKLRARGERPHVVALIEAFDRFRAAEFTAAERDANACLVDAIADLEHRVQGVEHGQGKDTGRERAGSAIAGRGGAVHP